MAGKKPLHPGVILKEKFLAPRKVSVNKLAILSGIPQTRLSDMVHSKRRITADNALRMAKFFGNTPTYWLKIQNDYDLAVTEKKLAKDLKKINKWRAKKK